MMLKIRVSYKPMKTADRYGYFDVDIDGICSMYGYRWCYDYCRETFVIKEAVKQHHMTWYKTASLSHRLLEIIRAGLVYYRAENRQLFFEMTYDPSNNTAVLSDGMLTFVEGTFVKESVGIRINNACRCSMYDR